MSWRERVSAKVGSAVRRSPHPNPLPTTGEGTTVSLVIGLMCILVAACSSPPPTATPTATRPPPTPTATAEPPPVPVVLPRDDAAHPAYNTEWWYYNGHLRADSGEEFSFHYVVFDVRYPGINPLNIYQAAITDHQSKTFVTGQQSVANPVPTAPEDAFAYASGSWVLKGHEGTDQLAATVGTYGFDLDLKQAKPAAMHGGIGHLKFTSTDKTYYYSRTRMETSGTLTRDGKPVKVTGSTWFDHQWGNFRVQAGGGGWDWFALQMDDGRDVMVFQLMDAQKKVYHIFATVVGQDGRTMDLEDTKVDVTATGSWTSPTSGGVYPMGWQLKLPSAGIDVLLKPVVEAAEFDASSTTFNRYWEGPVAISGSHGGKGFVEMVGYAPLRVPSR